MYTIETSPAPASIHAPTPRGSGSGRTTHRDGQSGGGPPRLDNEDQLVRDALRSPDAFATLYRHYLPAIHSFCYRRTGRRDIAEDLTAATFERALRNLPSFRPRGGGFGAWLYRIAANQVTDHYRREARPGSDRGQRAMLLLAEEADDDVDAAQLILAEERDRLRLAMTRLSPRHQEAISLRFLAELSNDDAATAMGLSRPHMAVVLHRAIRALKRALDEAGDET